MECIVKGRDSQRGRRPPNSIACPSGWGGVNTIRPAKIRFSMSLDGVRHTAPDGARLKLPSRRGPGDRPGPGGLHLSERRVRGSLVEPILLVLAAFIRREEPQEPALPTPLLNP